MSTMTTNLVTDLPLPPIPRLQNGDRLSREEFERRYNAQPTLKKAELIEGVVYMPSPVRQTYHSRQHFDTIGWLCRYRIATPGVEGGDNASLRLDLDSEPQPDAFLFLRPEYGGQVKIDEEGYLVGGPELIGEIAASSVSYDLHVKLNVYRRNGVKEYVVWRVEDNAIDWFVLRKGGYEPQALTDGIYRSEVFPGLWLDPNALIAGELVRWEKVMQAGLASQEHQDFVARLQSKK